jgi:hypothetical protein
VLSGALLAPLGSALAYDRYVPAQAFGMRAACMPDFLRFCRGSGGRGGAILCLNAYADQLSQPCFQALTMRGLQFAAALKACRFDFERYCSNMPLGPRQSVGCLWQNVEVLSPACRDALYDDEFEERPRPRWRWRRW